MHLSTDVIIIINNCCNCIVLYWARLTIMYQMDKVQMYLMVTLQGKWNMSIYSKKHLGYSSSLDKPVVPLMCHCVTVFEVKQLQNIQI